MTPETMTSRVGKNGSNQPEMMTPEMMISRQTEQKLPAAVLEGQEPEAVDSRLTFNYLFSNTMSYA
jgi:hypothetical protein